MVAWFSRGVTILRIVIIIVIYFCSHFLGQYLSSPTVIMISLFSPVDSLSESLSAGPPLEILPVGFDQLAEEQRTREEERHRQEEEQRQDRAEFLRQQGRELQDYLNRPGEEQQDTPTEV